MLTRCPIIEFVCGVTCLFMQIDVE